MSPILISVVNDYPQISCMVDDLIGQGSRIHDLKI